LAGEVGAVETPVGAFVVGSRVTMVGLRRGRVMRKGCVVVRVGGGVGGVVAAVEEEEGEEGRKAIVVTRVSWGRLGRMSKLALGFGMRVRSAAMAARMAPSEGMSKLPLLLPPLLLPPLLLLLPPPMACENNPEMESRARCAKPRGSKEEEEEEEEEMEGGSRGAASPAAGAGVAKYAGVALDHGAAAAAAERRVPCEAPGAAAENKDGACCCWCCWCCWLRCSCCCCCCCCCWLRVRLARAASAAALSVPLETMEGYATAPTPGEEGTGGVAH
jgi:hypothetical protein